MARKKVPQEPCVFCLSSPCECSTNPPTALSDADEESIAALLYGNKDPHAQSSTDSERRTELRESSDDSSTAAG